MRARRREDAIAKLAASYIDNIKAYPLFFKEKVKNRYTGQDEEPDERLMRSSEETTWAPGSGTCVWCN